MHFLTKQTKALLEVQISASFRTSRITRDGIKIRLHDAKLAREAGLSSNSAGELSYFAEKFAYGGGIIYFCLPC
jgi:hypothetical protein